MVALVLDIQTRKAHRAAAHHLDPVVMIGQEGLTAAVERETDLALSAHGLIKVRVAVDDRSEREAILAQLCDRLEAAPVQHIGKLLVIWRAPRDRARAQREDRMAGPKDVKVLKYSKRGGQRPEVKTVRVLGNQRLTSGGILKKSKARRASVKKRQAD